MFRIYKVYDPDSNYSRVYELPASPYAEEKKSSYPINYFIYYMVCIMHLFLLGACRTGDLQKVKSIQAAGIDIHAEDAFLQSCLYEQVAIVQFLLNDGANVHADKDYAIRMAKKYGHHALVKLLIQQDVYDFLRRLKDFTKANRRAIKQEHSNLINTILAMYDSNLPDDLIYEILSYNYTRHDLKLARKEIQQQ